MAEYKGDRVRAFHNESSAAHTLVAVILRGIDVAHDYVIELRAALTAQDCDRIVTIKTKLQATWSEVQVAIARLEQLSGVAQIHAREALRLSQESARDYFAQIHALMLQVSRKTRREYG